MKHRGFTIEVVPNRCGEGYYADYWPTEGGDLRRTGLPAPTLKDAALAGREAVDKLLATRKRNEQFFGSAQWVNFLDRATG